MGLIQGNNLGIEPIKTENKVGNDSIKKIHYDINDILYQYAKSYIPPMTGKRIVDKLTELGKELKQVDCQGNEILKANEILAALRQIIANINAYLKQFEWEESDKEIVQKVLNYCVYNYVEYKKTGELVDSLILKLLKRQKEIITDFIVPSNFRTLETKSFRSMNEELFKELNNRYDFLTNIRR